MSSIHIESIRVVTTNEQVLKSDAQNRPMAVEVVDLGSHTIDLSGTFKMTLTPGQMLHVHGTIQRKNNRLKLEFIARLKETTDIGRSLGCIKLELVQYERKMWGEIFSENEARQTEMNQLMDRIKGCD